MNFDVKGVLACVPSIKFGRSLIAVSIVLANIAFAANAADASKPKPVVSVAQAQQWFDGEQKPLYCRVFTPYNHQVASHVQAELSWVLPVGSWVKKGQLVAAQDDFYLNQTLDTLNVDIQTTQAQSEYSAKEYDRVKSLNNDDLISASSLNQLKLDLQTTQLRQKRLSTQLKTVKYQLERLKHYAPVDGRIGELTVQPGEWLSLGQAIVQLIPASDHEVTCKLPLALYQQFNGLKDVQFTLDNQHLLTLTRQDQALDAQTQTLNLYLQKPQSLDAPLLLEQRLTVTMIQQSNDLTKVPYDALTLENENYVIWSVDNDKKVAKQIVTIVDTRGEYVVIRSTLKGGDKVVIKGKQALKADIQVTLMGESS